MGSKPKQKDYEASGSEKASAAVAQAEYKYFKEKYDPLLQQMRDTSLKDTSTDSLRARANADTMQALTKPSAARAMRGADGGDIAQAYQGQLGIANTSGKDIQNKMQTNVLGTARGQASDAQSGMAQASNLATSQALTRAKNNQAVSDAKMTAVGQVAGAALMKGMQNKATTGQKDTGKVDAAGKPIMETVQGGFFSPVDDAGNKVSGFGSRLAASNFFGGG
tara:strand:- start:1395 stop:2060 length:666 start_codon:yes stop_codon:yes gene_type:complete